MVQRYDIVEVLDVYENEDGFMTVEVAMTRAGVFPYQQADGNVRMEAKLPEDVFDEATIESANGSPVTDRHPFELVTVENYNEYMKGTTHLQAKREGNLLINKETIFDGNLAAMIRAGKKQQVSIGFETEIVEESGTYDGQEYDVKQTDIRINHLAHVEQGRAGEDVKARLDSSDNVAIQVRIDGMVPNNPRDYGVNEGSDWSDITPQLPALSDMDDDRKEEIIHYYAWASSDDVDEITSKNSDLKLPHHTLEGDVKWGGVTSAMGYLRQTDIPESDKRDVYNHLTNHYRTDFNEEPPEFDSLEEADNKLTKGEITWQIKLR